ILNYKKNKTSIEQIVENILKKYNVEYMNDKKLRKTNISPDFFISKYNLIIECDGLYWHSDSASRIYKQYHSQRKQTYSNLGYKSLFFHEDEILNKSEIVESIILNKLGMSERIFARKCKIVTADKSFFEQNHLMGSGSGRIYSLEIDG